MRLCCLGGESDLAVPPWASVESYSPQLPPMATSLSRVNITLEGWGEGVAWPTLPPHYTEVSLFCGSHPSLERSGGLGG